MHKSSALGPIAVVGPIGVVLLALGMPGDLAVAQSVRPAPPSEDASRNPISGMKPGRIARAPDGRLILIPTEEGRRAPGADAPAPRPLIAPRPAPALLVPPRAPPPPMSRPPTAAVVPAPEPRPAYAPPPPIQRLSKGCGGHFNDPKVARPAGVLGRPRLLSEFPDPAFGACMMRVGESAEQEIIAPMAPDVQAWNADQSLILLSGGRIYDAHTFRLVRRIATVPAFRARAFRWSARDPYTFYYLESLVPGAQRADDGIACAPDSARLMKYKLTRHDNGAYSGRRELEHCFTEYVRFQDDASDRAISKNGRFVALVGERRDGGTDVFVYDLVVHTKGPVLKVPDDPQLRARVLSAAVSPSGRYLLVTWWYAGGARYRGVEAFDRRSLHLAGKVSPSIAQGDLVMDRLEQEYLIQRNGGEGQTTLSPKRNMLFKWHIPDGFDAYGTDTGATASHPLLTFTPGDRVRISCRNQGVPEGCLVTTYSSPRNRARPFFNELFLVGLDSTVAAPKVRRLAHHRSDAAFTEVTTDCRIKSSWAVPRATISRDGSRVLFGSTWGEHCRVEPYLIDLARVE